MSGTPSMAIRVAARSAASWCLSVNVPAVAYTSIIGIAQSFLLTFLEHGRAALPSASHVHVIRWRKRPGRGNRIDVGQHRAGGSGGRQTRADREGRGPGAGGGRGKEPHEHVRSGTGATGHPALEAPIRGSGSGKGSADAGDRYVRRRGDPHWPAS